MLYPVTVTVTARSGELKFESRYFSDAREQTTEELRHEAFRYADDCATRWHKHSPEGFDSFNVAIRDNRQSHGWS